MTAPDYAALIERLTLKNEDGTLCEITEDDQQEAADVIERLIAERDDAIAEINVEEKRFNDLHDQLREMINQRDTMQEQVKTLRAALNDATDIAIGHYGVDSRVAKMALEALAATDPKEKL